MDEESKTKEALNAAYHILTYQSRSRKELELKLKKKGFENSIISKTLQYLQKNNYINDLEFALQFGKSKINHYFYGKRLLEKELLQKGIEAHITQEVIDRLYSETDEQKVAEQLATKRMRIYKNLNIEVAKHRLMGLLQRKGFSADIILNLNWENIFQVKTVED